MKSYATMKKSEAVRAILNLNPEIKPREAVELLVAKGRTDIDAQFFAQIRSNDKRAEGDAKPAKRKGRKAKVAKVAKVRKARKVAPVAAPSNVEFVKQGNKLVELAGSVDAANVLLKEYKTVEAALAAVETASKLQVA